MAIHVCTIIARNYLSLARVLASSFFETNPGGTLSVLVIDDRYKSTASAQEDFEVLRLDEVGIDDQEALRMAAFYGVTEFATAVKPWLLQKLIDRWNEPVIYLDPDIMVFRSLGEIVELLERHEIVITPHSIQPIPRDGKSVSESEILAAGIYNLGFIGVGLSGLRFLKFWRERLRRECLSEPVNMRFVDQRWVDFAPSMFDAFILKDPTYNVAYWNLHGYRFAFDPTTNQYLIDGRPINFFHFSGYNPRVPELLSKYQGGNARILFSESPDLKILCDFYAEQLFAQGYDETSENTYGYSNLDNGMPYDIYMRQAYRDALLKGEADEAPIPPNPFYRADLFVLWLNSPDEKEVISRYLKKMYEGRADLQHHFPDATGTGLTALVAWCWDESSKGNFDQRLIPKVLGEVGIVSNVGSGSRRPDVFQGGIQVSGYFKAEMGVGELGRNTIKTIATSGIPYSTLTITDVIHRQNLDFIDRKADGHAINVVCMNADSIVHFAYRMGAEYFRNRYTIGVWAWEIEEFPEEFDTSFQYVDEIWASSEFTREAIAARGLKPVYTLPVTVQVDRVETALDRSTLGIPQGFLFLFCFDLLSIFDRKNPLGVIDAFTKAFQPNEGPVLVIKALNGDKRLAGLEKIRIRARGRSDIVILDKYLERDDNVSLFNESDCYVSLHRSEGLGLTIAEAMSLGKPVIATAYSGNMDFMKADNSYLIPFTYGLVPKGCDPYRPGARWAEPDISEAAKAMRYVFENPAAAAKVGGRARQYMEEKHSPDATSSFILERYQHAIESLDGDARHGASALSGSTKGAQTGTEKGSKNARTSEGAAMEDVTPPLIELAARPIAYDGRSRFDKIGRIARRILRKLMLVRDNQQKEINLALAMGTEHLARLWNSMQESLLRLEDAQTRESQGARALGMKVDLVQKILSQFNTNIETLNGLVAEMDTRNRDIERTVADASGLVAEMNARNRDIERTVADASQSQSAQLQVIPYMSDPETFTLREGVDKEFLGFRGNSRKGLGHASFEDIFRGPEELIRNRMRAYVSLINPADTVVDIGSGRGEFLDVLRDAGVNAIGVDIDESMVERSTEKGHEVIKQDAVAFLRSREDGSISTIFSAQFIEHLSYSQLRHFLRESYRSLSEGGVLILETVNPYSVPAFRTFWTDLTHERPIFPEVLLALLMEEGFDEARVIFPNGTESLEVDRWVEGEYAVIAHRRSDVS
ncbi:MAG TPA: glycosyltransferase [Acidimicrobiales bacterium]|nr:glycosyltransferase [Acidimicrobiales bacterium]